MAEVPYPQVSQAQVDLWLNDPVTKLYLIAISEKDRATAEAIGNGAFRDPTNNDKTCNVESELHGRRYAYQEMQAAEGMLNYMNFIQPEAANG